MNLNLIAWLAFALAVLLLGAVVALAVTGRLKLKLTVDVGWLKPVPKPTTDAAGGTTGAVPSAAPTAITKEKAA